MNRFILFMAAVCSVASSGLARAQSLGGVCSLENDTGYAYSPVTSVAVTVDCSEAVVVSNVLSGTVNFSDSFVDVPMDTTKVMSISVLGCGFQGQDITNLFYGACKNPATGAWLCSGARSFGFSGYSETAEAEACLPVSTLPLAITTGIFGSDALSINSVTGVEVLPDRLRFVCGQGRWTSSQLSYSWTTMRAVLALKP